MTQRTYRSIYLLLAATAVLLVAGGIVLAVLIVRDRRLAFFLADIGIYREYFVFGSPYGLQIVAALNTLALSVAGLGSLVIMLASFRNTVSKEAFMLAVMAFTFCFEPLRLAILLMVRRGSAASSIVTLARVVMGARFAGGIAMFLASLHAIEDPSGKKHTGVPYVLFLSVLLAGLLPVSMDTLRDSFLPAIGYERLGSIIMMVLTGLSLLDFLVAAIQQEDRRYAGAGICVLVAAIAWMQLWQLHAPLDTALLTGLVAAGMYGALALLHAIHVWR
ncbi:MAG: hypothetical protein N2067_00035 [Spirochaetaceae bacterium]|nr:hypothetical protein [Spirochaetaceae bacterium]